MAFSFLNSVQSFSHVDLNNRSISVISTNTTLTNSYVNSKSWPIYIVGGTSSSPIIITLGQNLSLSSINNYFLINTDHVIFEGSNNTITFNDVANYLGFIQNGTSTTNGCNHIYVQNLTIVGMNSNSGYSAGLHDYAGWFGQAYFGKNAINNVFNNCVYINNAVPGYNYTGPNNNSYGNTPPFGGGISGAYTKAKAIKCIYYGVIIDTDSGGIFGSGSNVNLINCYSNTGSGYLGNLGICNNAGGLVGSNSIVDISSCYINIATGCYPITAGLLVGSNGSGYMYNSYGVGQIWNSNGNQIYGTAPLNGYTPYTLTTQNCYNTSSWVDSEANNSLVNINNGIWTDINLYVTNLPYVLTTFNTSIGDMNEPSVLLNSISGLQLWLDANNYSSFILNGNKVSEWDDLAGNSSVYATTNQPIYSSTGLNGKPTLQFTPENALISNSVSNYSYLTNFNYFAVLSVSSITGGIIPSAFSLKNSQSGGSALAIYLSNYGGIPNNTIYGAAWTYNNTGIPGFVSNSVVTPTDTFIIVQLSISDNMQTFYINGIPGNSTSCNFNGSSSLNVLIGNSGYGDWFTGNISEIIVYSSNLDTNNRQKIEGYLAWKWGLTANLSSSHPYYSKSPVNTTNNNNVTQLPFSSNEMNSYYNNFTLVRINNDLPTNYPNITMNTSTGSFTFDTNTYDGSYSLLVYAQNNYSYQTSSINNTYYTINKIIYDISVGIQQNIVTIQNANIEINQAWVDSHVWPCYIQEGTYSNVINIHIIESITLTNAAQYFIIQSDYVTIDGSNNVINISNISNYLGLIQNGAYNVNETISPGYNNITVQNIIIDNSNNSSTIANYAGWFGQNYFGNDASNNIFNYCFNANGNVSNYGGGIVGANSNVKIYASGFTSNIIGNEGGGLCGKNSTCNILDSYANTLSYLSPSSGGLCGSYSNITAVNCYSIGNTQGNAGAFTGIHCNGSITNSYSIGNIYAFIGENSNVSTINCYNASSNNTWSESTAVGDISGVDGSIWIDITELSGFPIPFALSVFETSLYSANIMDISSVPFNTIPANNSYNNFTIISINGLNPSKYQNISINNNTGVIAFDRYSYINTYNFLIYAYNTNLYTYAVDIFTCNLISPISNQNIITSSITINQSYVNTNIWPILIDTSNNSQITVTFTENIILNNAFQYFIIDSSNITIDGGDYTIDISGVSNYTGLIQNGTVNQNGYNSIILKNVLLTQTNSSAYSWFGSNYFGKNATNNLIHHCYVYSVSGSFIGDYSKANFNKCGFLFSSTGSGGFIGNNSNSTISNCYVYAPNTNNGYGYVYSNTGGFVGSNATTSISQCYIYGVGSGSNANSFVGPNSTSTISNVYSIGSFSGTGGNPYHYYNSPTSTYFSTHTADAYNTLLGEDGSIWNSFTTPFLLSAFNDDLYNTNSILDSLSTSTKNAILYSGTGTALSACAFGLKLLYSGYTGPIINIKRSSDNTISDFYADINGNFGTVYLGNGIPLSYWLNGAIAYVVKWYDQTGNQNHAIGNPNLLPILANTTFTSLTTTPPTGYYINFPAPMNNNTSFFSLPNGAFPYGNSNYSYVTKTYCVPFNNPGNITLVGGGDNTVNGGYYGNCGIRYITSGGYNHFWWNTDQNTSVLNGNYTHLNEIATFTYNNSVKNRYIYVNGNLIDTNGNGSLPIRQQTNTYNYIGYIHNWTRTDESYANSNIYFLHVLPIDLSTVPEDRIILENTSLFQSSTNLPFSSPSSTSSIYTNYSILSVNNLPSSQFTNITINSLTGVIDFSNNTYDDEYFIQVYATDVYGRYNINYFNCSITTGNTPANAITSTTYIDNTFVNSATWPIPIQGGTVLRPIYIYLTEDITISNINQYFIINSNYIVFNGNNQKITINNISQYPGLFKNGSAIPSASGNIYVNTYNNITIENIILYNNNSILQNYQGWFGQIYFGIDASNNNFINCFNSNGDIPSYGGGIIGAYSNASINICATYTQNINEYGGGIGGYNSNTIVNNCYASITSNIYNYAGGLTGSNSIITCTNSYVIADLSNSYSGVFTGSNSSGSVFNSYFYGTINSNNSTIGDGSTTNLSYCYITSSWSNSIANINLYSVLDGGVWIDTSFSSTPYQLTAFNNSIYTINNITVNSLPYYSPNGSSIFNNYSLISVNNTDVPSTIIIDSRTGVISLSTSLIQNTTYIINILAEHTIHKYYSINTYTVIVPSNTTILTNINNLIPEDFYTNYKFDINDTKYTATNNVYSTQVFNYGTETYDASLYNYNIQYINNIYISSSLDTVNYATGSSSISFLNTSNNYFYNSALGLKINSLENVNTNGISFSFWIKTLSNNPHNITQSFFYLSETSGNSIYMGYLYDGSNQGLKIINGQMTDSLFIINPPSLNGTWNHFVFIITNTNTWQLYINNSEITLPSFTNGSSNYLYDGLYNKLYIGAKPTNANGVLNNYLNGNIDDFRIYNRALTINEIMNLYTLEINSQTNYVLNGNFTDGSNNWTLTNCSILNDTQYINLLPNNSSNTYVFIPPLQTISTNINIYQNLTLNAGSYRIKMDTIDTIDTSSNINYLFGTIGDTTIFSNVNSFNSNQWTHFSNTFNLSSTQTGFSIGTVNNNTSMGLAITNIDIIPIASLYNIPIYGVNNNVTIKQLPFYSCPGVSIYNNFSINTINDISLSNYSYINIDSSNGIIEIDPSFSLYTDITDISGLQLWLDAYSASNVITNNGNQLSTWKDRSGKGNDATTSTSSNIIYTTFNSKPAIQFINNSTRLNISNNLINNYYPMTLFCVFNFAGVLSNTQTNILFSGYYNDSPSGFVFQIYQDFTTLGYRISIGVTRGQSNGIVYTDFFSNTGLCMVTVVLPNTTLNPGEDPILNINGDLSVYEASPPYVNAVSPPTNGAYIESNLGMFVCEEILFNSLLSTTDYQKIEGYLAWKWGINTSLPTSHPYYYNIPISTNGINETSYFINVNASNTMNNTYNNSTYNATFAIEKINNITSNIPSADYFTLYSFNTIDVSMNTIMNYGSALYDLYLNNSASIDYTNYIVGNGSLSLNASLFQYGLNTNLNLIIDASINTNISGISICFWHKTNIFSTPQTLFYISDVSNSSLSANVIHMEYITNGNDGIQMTVGHITDNSNSIFIPKTYTNDGNWHHFAFIIPDNSGSTINGNITSSPWQLYIDNIEYNLPTGTNYYPLNAIYNYLYIGAGNNSNCFSGNIDEFYIYNRTLTEIEITNIYTNAIHKYNPVSNPPIDFYTCYNMSTQDQYSATSDLWNYANQSYDASMINGAIINGPTNGIGNTSLSLNNFDTTYLSTLTEINGLQLWLDAKSSSTFIYSTQTIYDKSSYHNNFSPGTTNAYKMTLTSLYNQPTFFIPYLNDKSYCNTLNLQPNITLFFVINFDTNLPTTNNNVYLYGTISGGISITQPSTPNSNNIYIGYNGTDDLYKISTNLFQNSFNLLTVQITSNTLSVNINGTNVLSNVSYSANFNTTSYYQQGGGNTSGTTSASTLYLSEMVIYNSILSSTDYQKVEGYLAWKWEISNQLYINHPYYSLLSSNQYVYNQNLGLNINANSNLNISGLSFSFWAKNNIDNNQSFFSIIDVSNTAGLSNFNIINMRYRNSSGIELMVGDLSDNQNNCVINNITYDTEWHHYVWIIPDNSGSLWQLYIDNISYSLPSFSNGSSIYPSNALYNYLLIGARKYYSIIDDFFTGNIDDFRIYNRILTRQEMKNIYFTKIFPITNFNTNVPYIDGFVEKFKYLNINATLLSNLNQVDPTSFFYLIPGYPINFSNTFQTFYPNNAALSVTNYRGDVYANGGTTNYWTSSYHFYDTSSNFLRFAFSSINYDTSLYSYIGKNLYVSNNGNYSISFYIACINSVPYISVSLDNSSVIINANSINPTVITSSGTNFTSYPTNLINIYQSTFPVFYYFTCNFKNVLAGNRYMKIFFGMANNSSYNVNNFISNISITKYIDTSNNFDLYSIKPIVWLDSKDNSTLFNTTSNTDRYSIDMYTNTQNGTPSTIYGWRNKGWMKNTLTWNTSSRLNSSGIYFNNSPSSTFNSINIYSIFLVASYSGGSTYSIFPGLIGNGSGGGGDQNFVFGMRDSTSILSQLNNAVYYINGRLTTAVPNINSLQIMEIVSSSVTTLNNVSIGLGDSGDRWNGNIAEVIMFDSIISNETRQKVEAYLAKKWGLVSQLDISNNYVSYDTSIIDTSHNATGGTIVSSNEYNYHVFTTSSSMTFPFSGSVDYLIIGGGGAGGNSHGGGGGAGRVVSGSFSVSPNTYSVTVGNGGTTTGQNIIFNGEDSSVFNITAIGGGHGSGNNSGLATSGGSGGGGSGYNDKGYSSPYGATTKMSSVNNLGNNGGNGFLYSNNAGGGGGGGGSGGAGYDYNGNQGGIGGAGTTDYFSWLISINSIMSTAWQTATNNGQVIASGGSGGSWFNYPPTYGPLGGGGSGGTNNSGFALPTDAIANTGSGGGGGGSDNQTGANGSSGLVIIRYLNKDFNKVINYIPPNIDTSNNVNYLYEPDTHLILDTSSNDTGFNPSTISNNNVTFTTIANKQCAYFNNLNTTFLSMPFIQQMNNFSFSFWVYTIDNSYYTCATITDSTLNNPSLNMDIVNNTSINIFITLPSYWTYYVYNTNSIQNWIHVTYTIDLNNYAATTYINGTFVNQTIGTGGFNYNPTQFILGRSGDGGNTGRGFNGYIREFLFYRKILTAPQVMDIYNNTM